MLPFASALLLGFGPIGPVLPRTGRVGGAPVALRLLGQDRVAAFHRLNREGCGISGGLFGLTRGFVAVGRVGADPVMLGPFDRNEDRGGAIGGAVLGGLLGGPFGALWGASLGNSLGAGRREERENEEQLNKMGLDRDTRKLAQQLAGELAEAESGVEVCASAERSQLRFVEQLRASAAELYASAEAKLRAGDEDVCLLPSYVTTLPLRYPHLSSWRTGAQITTCVVEPSPVSLTPLVCPR